MHRNILIFTTTPTLKDARKISRALIANRLAACASTLNRVESVFRWKGKVTVEREFLTIIKTRSEMFNQAARIIKKLHPYEVPEIIAIPVTEGSQPYLKWLEESIQKPAE